MARFNSWDGLLHNNDGSREFADGGTVGGANTWLGKSSKMHTEQSSVENKLEAISQGAFEATNDYITMQKQEYAK